MEFRVRETRAVDDRLVVAGEQAAFLAELRDPHRAEVLFEELARLHLVVAQRACGGRTPTHLAQRLVDRTFVLGRSAGKEWITARAERAEGSGVIVFRPAIEVGPLDRFKLGIGRTQRIDIARIDRQRGEHPQGNSGG
jgi:hypothetical protein